MIVEWSRGYSELKVFGIISRWVFIVSLPVLFFTISLAWGFNSLWLYKYGFQKYNVSQSTGLPENQLDKAARGLIRYFNSGEEYVYITIDKENESFQLFNQEEQIHFRDVKQLVWLDYKVLAGTLIFFLSYVIVSIFWRGGKYRRYLAGNIVRGSLLTIFLIIVLGIASLFNFDRLFLQLHYLIFTNQFWSAEGYMLMLFPGGFWYDATFFCIGVMAGLAVVMGILSIIYLRMSRFHYSSQSM
jgi:integral membrane protein (TIGR01906 family)